MQLKFLEEQIGAHRKSRKALCAKQRTAKKAGREFPEADAEKLKLVTEEQSKIQKQLDQVRKQQKEHTNLIAEYRSKQQQHQQGSGLMPAGPSTQNPQGLSKMPGQVMMGQQGAPIMGQPPGYVPQGGMPVRMPQGQPFMGAQPPHPGAMGAAQPVAPAGFFPQGPGFQGSDPRLLHERQLQHRMQMVQKLQQQQQLMMGQQQPMPPQGQQPGMMAQQQGGLVPQAQQGMMANPLMAQTAPNLQQGLMTNQQNQPGLIQTPQGMMGSQVVPQPQQNLMGQPMSQTQNMLAGQQGMVGNQMVQQRPQVMMGQQGPVGPQVALRSLQGQLTPQQQQNLLAQRMLLQQQQQQQQKNLAQLQQQQQASQQRQQTPMSPAEPQRVVGTPPSANAQPSQTPGTTEGLQQGLVPGITQDAQSSATKEGGILSPKTPSQQMGPLTPGQMQQGPSGDVQGVVAQQQQTPNYVGQQQVPQQQMSQSPASSGLQPQQGFVNNQQAVAQQQQQQVQLTLQRQSSGTERTELVTIKQEGQQMCFMAQQQQQQVGQNVMQQPQDGINQQPDGTVQLQNPMVQNHPGQTQPGMAAHPNVQQQVLLVQQQKQAMMGQIDMMRGQQQMMGQRPGAPTGQIRTPINIQAIIAQNPQLRHLTPQQQIQHIQQMIAQRQLQQGQMMRMSAAQGQVQGQMHPQAMQGQVQQVGPRMPGLEGQQQLHYGIPGKQGLAGTPQQPGVMGQQFQQGLMPQQQPSQQGVSPQYGLTVQQQQMMQQQQVQQQQMMRGQVPLPRAMMGQVRASLQGRMVRPMSPHQSLGQGSPGDPSAQQRQALLMRQTSPAQAQPYQQLPQQQQMATAMSPFQASPSHAGSPAGATGQKQESDSSPARIRSNPGTPSLSCNISSPARVDGGAGKNSPYNPNMASASPIRSPLAKTPQDHSGLKSELHGCGSEVRQTTPLNGPSPQLGDNPRTGAQQTPGSSEGVLCKVTLQNIKQEPKEVQCDTDGAGVAHTGIVKREASGEPVSNTSGFPQGNVAGDPGSHIPRTETGQQLLQKLLRTKNLQLASQRPSEGIHNEINGHINSKLAMLEQKLQGTPRNMEDLQSITKRPPVVKAKRNYKAAERGPNSRKKTKKEEVGKSTEALMKQLKQGLSLLPLMEPSITASLDLFAPFGSSPANGKAQLKGSFGNAVLDNIPDYYSQLLTKNNLSNPPTPPSSLPPTPPPSVQHKLLNGVTAVEELSEDKKETEASENTMDSVAEEVKSVDILAALPTPPHNQNEDIRMESDDDSDALDGIVPASSPESQIGEDIPRFPLLEPKEEENERAISPVIPIIPRAAIPVFPETKPFEAVDGKVVSTTGPWDKAKNNEVSVTFTLSAAAAKNLNTVMVAVAQLLHMRIPSSYEVTFPQSPGRAGGAGPGKGPDPSNPGALCLKPGTVDGNQDAEWVRQFDVTLPGCTLKKQIDILSLIKQECPEEEDRPVQHCYTTNVSDLDVRHLPVFPVEESPPPSPSPPPPPPPPPPASVPALAPAPVPTPTPVPETETASDAVADAASAPPVDAPAETESLPAQPSSPSPSPAPVNPADAIIKTEPEQEMIVPPDQPPAASSGDDAVAAAIAAALTSPLPKQEPSPSVTPIQSHPPFSMALSPKLIKQRSRPLSGDDLEVKPKMKKWKGLRWKRLQLVITIRKGGSKKENSREVSELMERLQITLRPNKMPRDKRKCCFCHEEGDGATDGPARLLNIDVDLWVHLNCALWSTEVYETQGGALMNVEVALRRGLGTRCAYCQKSGATNSCNRLRCPNVYHFACAIRARCMFFKDKTMLCTQHKLKGPSEEELSTFAVFRRVYIERDEVKQIASILQRGDRIHMFRVGGLIFHAVGQLLPSQMACFHSPTAIFPVGYEATRIYWSTRVPNKRCRYRCRISETECRPLFEVRVLSGVKTICNSKTTALMVFGVQLCSGWPSCVRRQAC
ncbi:hypothetical protein AALO_G00053050 [Alosa alosa]|uniref:[histone H3]-lysine(4) N-methyltransferase n=1 Tax=Alosa alosa TaxID=278164 RepID=A0AAV6H851_9TELE|nr:hypothetical protein AALO_G00053050 [Alosa alosa]